VLKELKFKLQIKRISKMQLLTFLFPTPPSTLTPSLFNSVLTSKLKLSIPLAPLLFGDSPSLPFSTLTQNLLSLLPDYEPYQA
jgi:hypothetical protein